jgi:hypothetical protein
MRNLNNNVYDDDNMLIGRNKNWADSESDPGAEYDDLADNNESEV